MALQNLDGYVTSGSLLFSLDLMILLCGQSAEECVGEDEGGGDAPPQGREGRDDAPLRDEGLAHQDEQQVHACTCRV